MPDDGSYNPDGYGCRKPALAVLALLLAAVLFICL